MYGQEAIIKNSLKTDIYSASINVIPGQQEYDLTNYIPEYTNSNVQLI